MLNISLVGLLRERYSPLPLPGVHVSAWAVSGETTDEVRSQRYGATSRVPHPERRSWKGQ